jgi:hypothetical protein
MLIGRFLHECRKRPISIFGQEIAGIEHRSRPVRLQVTDQTVKSIRSRYVHSIPHPRISTSPHWNNNRVNLPSSVGMAGTVIATKVTGVCGRLIQVSL